ncbi:hypothetical protein E4U39_001884 [Claviceps sp. Clav50 group G5]|nr:hypothetical protein E4U39_001884 [Claviceps sp. Clav50 group G5]
MFEGQLTENDHHEEAFMNWDTYNYMDPDPDLLFDTDSLEVPEWMEPSVPYLEDYTFRLSDGEMS